MDADSESDYVDDQWGDEDAFEDMPVSDAEGGADSVFEEDQLSIVSEEPISGAFDSQPKFRQKPELSVIHEESRVESVMSTDVVQPKHFDAWDEKTMSEADFFGQKGASNESGQFVSGGAALNLLRGAEVQFETETPFIQDDPRFDRTHFSKENSWEPSIYAFEDNSSNAKFGAGAVPLLPHVVKGDQTTPPNAKPMPFRVAALKEQAQPSQSQHSVSRGNNMGGPMFSSSPVNTSNISPTNAHTDSMLINKQMSTPQALIQGKRPSRFSLQKSLEEKFSDVSAIQPEPVQRVLNFEETSPRKVAPIPQNVSAVSEHSLNFSALRQTLKNVKIDSDDQECLELISKARKQRQPRPKPNFTLQSSTIGQNENLEPSRNTSINRRMDSQQRAELTELSNHPRKPAENIINDWKDPRRSHSQSKDPSLSMRCERSVSLTRNQDKREHQPVTYSRSLTDSERNKENMKGKEACKQQQFPEPASKYNNIARSFQEQEVSISRAVSVASSADPCRPVSQALSSVSTQKSTRSGLSVSTRNFYFGFVEVGQSLTQRLTVTNSTNHPMTVSSLLTKGNKNFEIVENAGSVMVPGHQTMHVAVRFTPSECARFMNYIKFISKCDGQSTSYKVAMIGSGGVASLSVHSLQAPLPVLRDGSLVLRCPEPLNIQLELKNSGTRAAFARIVVFGRNEQPLRTLCSPSDSLVIKSGTKGAAIVSIRVLDDPNDWDTASMAGSRSSIGSSASQMREGWQTMVRVYWGEEMQRQRLKSWEIQRHREKDVWAGCGNMCVPFLGEKPFDAAPDHPVARDDKDIFRSQLRYHAIYVSSTRVSLRPASAFSADFTMDGNMIALEPADQTMNTTVCGRTVVYDADVTITPTGSGNRRGIRK